MLKKNKIVLLSGLLLMLPFLLKAQVSSSTTTSSPYSRYGLGYLSNYSFGRSEAMGGIGIGMRNPFQINPGNPASYTSLDSLSFLTQFGLSSRFTETQSSNAQNYTNNTNFDFLAFSFPVKKWWGTAFGIIPFSNKGYNLNSSSVTADSTTASVNFNGTGTLSRVFLGNGFNLGKNFSVGINAWYMFGTLIDQVYTYFPYDPNAYDFLSSKNLNVRHFGFTAGVQYHFRTKNKNTWIIGATFEPSQNLSVDYSSKEDMSLFRGSTTQTSIDTTLFNITSPNHKLTIPLSVGLGVSYTIKDRMVIGADYYYQKWSQAGGEQYFLDQVNVNSQSTPVSTVLTDRSRISLGMELTPDPNSLTSYFKRSSFRGGLFYDKSYLLLNNQQINSYGLTLGLGLPFPKSRSSFNLSAELGHLGSVQNNLLAENYVKFTLHILLYERWFQKRKFD